jgi:hypothetical protein
MFFHRFRDFLSVWLLNYTPPSHSSGIVIGDEHDSAL